MLLIFLYVEFYILLLCWIHLLILIYICNKTIVEFLRFAIKNHVWEIIDSFTFSFLIFDAFLFYFLAWLLWLRLPLLVRMGNLSFLSEEKLWFLVIYSACWYCFIFFQLQFMHSSFCSRFSYACSSIYLQQSGKNKRHVSYGYTKQVTSGCVCVSCPLFFCFVFYLSFSLPRWSQCCCHCSDWVESVRGQLLSYVQVSSSCPWAL